MRKRPASPKHTYPLPQKPRPCSLCSFISSSGQNDLQIHMDTQHKGWAENFIKKMDIHEAK